MERIAVRAILLNKEGKVLVGKRADGIGKGQWALIGGKPDDGESNEAAVIRETKEEVGLDFNNPIYFTQELNDNVKPGQYWRTTYYYGTAFGELKLKSDEIEEARYVGREDLANLDFAFGHDKILEDFFERKG